MSGNLESNLQKYKVKTVYIKLPEFIYDKLLKYKLVYRLDEIIVNHLIDVVEEKEAKRNNKIEEELEDIDDEAIPELEGMIEKKKKYY
jgi:hypothetical protein